VATIEVPAHLVRDQIRALRYAFQEACRMANEAVRQRDYYRERAIRAECALMEATGGCPDAAVDPCLKVFGLRCQTCAEAMDKEARYL